MSLISVRDAIGALKHSRSSTLVALVLLATGMGASTTVYSVVDAVLRGLPFDSAGELAKVSGRDANGRALGVTPQDYLDWKTRQDAFAAVAASASGPDLVIREPQGTTVVPRTRMTASLFTVLRVQPQLGQPFTDANEAQGNHLVALVSDAFWRRRFGADPSIVGKTMVFETATYQIIGVMPRGFTFPIAADPAPDVYTPYVVPASQRVRGTGRSFTLEVIGRRSAGASLDEARRRMERLHQQLAAEFPDWYQGRGILVQDYREALVGQARSWMLMLAGAVGFLLLLVCMNVSAIALARGLSRAPEIAIRAALGATRWQIARVLILENVIAWAIGTLAGIGLAVGGVAVVRAALPPNLPQVSDVAVDARVLLAAATAALAAALICSIVPALRCSHVDPASSLRHAGGRERAGGIGIAKYLVCAEVALSVVLLVGAGLFLASFNQLMRVDLGLDHRNVLTVPAFARFTGGDYPKAVERAAVMLPQVLERARTIPGVEGVAAIAGGVPLSGGSIRSSIRLPGRDSQSEQMIDVHRIGGEYFGVLRIPVLAGRTFSGMDTRHSPPVAIMNKEAAALHFPQGDPIGRNVLLEDGKEWTIVGVVGNLRLSGPDRPLRPELYVPLAQSDVIGADLVLRTTGPPQGVAAAAKAAIWSVEPATVIPDPITLEARLGRLIAPRKFNMLLFTVIGLFAIAIAAAGVFGVIAQYVELRRSELAVRLALGAQRSQILRLVLSRALLYLAAGLVIGGLAAWNLAGFVEGFLFQVPPRDVTVYVLAALVLASSGLAAALAPALRAMRTDPLITLKAAP